MPPTPPAGRLVRAAALLAALALPGTGCAQPADDGGAWAAADSARVAETVRVIARAELALPQSAPVALARRLPPQFVYLRDVAPTIAEEIRYTTPFNFVGEPIDGYLAPVCVLTPAAAAALRLVALDLAPDGLGLKVYDCYRPQRAVDHFGRWARDPRREADAMKAAFFPEEPRGQLFARGYVSAQSGHTRGSTVDLTLVRLPAGRAVLPPSALPDDADGPLPRCDGPRGVRLDERDLDMGTAYDCLSPRAATEAPGLPAEVLANRRRLVDAMAARGFRNYEKEWWHFTLRDEPHPFWYPDFPVE